MLIHYYGGPGAFSAMRYRAALHREFGKSKAIFKTMIRSQSV